jgi:murein DD-endopeptidase MepM/ murein hydrolase activator NlpD
MQSRLILEDAVLATGFEEKSSLKTSKLYQAGQPSRLDSIVSAAVSLQSMAHRHPRRISAAVLAVLAGSAMTAFGVAPLTNLPPAPAPIVTQINEQLQPPELQSQLQQLETQTLSLFRSDVTRSADTVDSLLQRLGVHDAEASQFIRRDPVAGTLLQGRTGKSVKAVVEDGQLKQLVARGPAASQGDFDTHFTRLTIERDAASGTLRVKQETVPLEASTQLGSGVIRSSLFAAADDARIPDGVTNQIAEIFGNEIDFRRELRKGDAFSVLYEAHLADGEPVTWGVSHGRVLAARFINKGDTHDAVWFQEAGRKGAYFDLNGRSTTRAFLASPLAFSRVTSGFAMRFHPVHKTMRAHLGVDFGAPTGTPVRSVGEGVVTFSGWQNGYGNVVHVEHSGGRSTVYAHLSRIDARRGQRIEQGQTLGAVGATGWATGPHLHFEFKFAGKQVDPMKVARASESLQLSPQSLARFRTMAVSVAQRLDRADAVQTAGLPTGSRFE